MRALDFGVCALATWRLAHMVTLEDGPGDVFVTLRARLGVSLMTPMNGPPRRTAESFLGKLVLCPLCLSVWIAPVVLGAWLCPPFRPFLTALALSGASSALELHVNRS